MSSKASKKFDYCFLDMFCGCGGSSWGARQVFDQHKMRVNMFAVNHNEKAIASHRLNMPDVTAFESDIWKLNPQAIARTNSVSCIWSSPSCVNHTRARNPNLKKDVQDRAHGWAVLDFVQALRPAVFAVENVMEFMEWGPLDEDGRPIEETKGVFYDAWISVIHKSGYKTSVREVCCADYGDPTTRTRFMLIATRSGLPIEWKPHTHAAPDKAAELGRLPWRSAMEVLDWDRPGWWLHEREPQSRFDGLPLSPNTIRRIHSGMDQWLQDMQHSEDPERDGFIIGLRGTADRQIDASYLPWGSPMPTVSTAGAHHMLVRPFILGQQSCAAARGVNRPLPTAAGAGAMMLVRPYLLKYYGTATTSRLEAPMPTVTCRDRFMLVRPILRMPDNTTAEVFFNCRMLNVNELKKSMSFPADFQLVGTIEDQKKQVGNAVPVQTAAAVTESMLPHIEWWRWKQKRKAA